MKHDACMKSKDLKLRLRLHFQKLLFYLEEVISKHLIKT